MGRRRAAPAREEVDSVRTRTRVVLVGTALCAVAVASCSSEGTTTSSTTSASTSETPATSAPGTTGRATKASDLSTKDLEAFLEDGYGDASWAGAFNGVSIVTAGGSAEVYLNTSAALTEDEALEACEATGAWLDDEAVAGSVTVSVDDVPMATQAPGDEACESA